MHSVPITIPGAPHNFTLTYIHSQLSSFATLLLPTFTLNFLLSHNNNNNNNNNICIMLERGWLRCSLSWAGGLPPSGARRPCWPHAAVWPRIPATHCVSTQTSRSCVTCHFRHPLRDYTDLTRYVTSHSRHPLREFTDLTQLCDLSFPPPTAWVHRPHADVWPCISEIHCVSTHTSRSCVTWHSATHCVSTRTSLREYSFFTACVHRP